MIHSTTSTTDNEIPSYFQPIQERMENAHPAEILRWTVKKFGDKAIVVTSFQPTGIVTLHMLQEIAPQLPVVTLDTGLLFPETQSLIEDVTRRFKLNLMRVSPELTLQQQTEQYGEHLWEDNPDRCCGLRKVEPLSRVLINYSAWITGLRRDQSRARMNVPAIGWDSKRGMAKISPFASWTEDMIWTYIHAHDLPYNELHNQGYPSIGCYPCTRAIHAEEDLRDGRWTHHMKTECGIHL